jgi:hypothetical protein
MLFTPTDEESGYAEYCRVKQKFEMFYKALENDGLLSNKVNQLGYREISKTAPNDAKNKYAVLLEKIKKNS